MVYYYAEFEQEGVVIKVRGKRYFLFEGILCAMQAIRVFLVRRSKSHGFGSGQTLISMYHLL